MATTHYDRLKQAADEEHRLNIEAIERVQRMEEAMAKLAASPPAGANGAVSNYVAPRKFKKPRQPGAHKGKVIDALRKIIAGLDGEFTRQIIEERLQASHPKVTPKTGSLKAAMKRLADTGEIRVLVQGQGRRHAKYQRGESLKK